jgi:hypothetical protein
MRMLTLLLLVSILFFGCVSDTTDSTEKREYPMTVYQGSPVNDHAGDSVRVEVYHFHGTHQCPSCIAVGELAEKTVNTYFKDELKSGKLVFGHINGELPENKGLVEKYGVTSSSLWIGTYANGEFHREQNVNVWYKINNEEEYMAYLRGVVEDKLAG